MHLQAGQVTAQSSTSSDPSFPRSIHVIESANPVLLCRVIPALSHTPTHARKTSRCHILRLLSGSLAGDHSSSAMGPVGKSNIMKSSICQSIIFNVALQDTISLENLKSYKIVLSRSSCLKHKPGKHKVRRRCTEITKLQNMQEK